MEKEGQPDYCNALLVATDAVTYLKARLKDAIDTIETLKKAPDYNTNMTVELAFSCAWMQSFRPDCRQDDPYLEQDTEPVSAI